MFSNRTRNLDPILRSASSGPHLSLYVSHRHGPGSVRSQVSDAIATARYQLGSILNPGDRSAFLAPIEALLEDQSALASFRTNAAVFRRKDAFWMTAIPVPVDPFVSIASSFHVKPLLGWLQADREVLMLGINGKHASFYVVSQTDCRHIHRLDFRSFPAASYGEILEGIDHCVKNLLRADTMDLYVVGAPKYAKRAAARLRYPRTIRDTIAVDIDENGLVQACFRVRALERERLKRRLESLRLEVESGERVHVPSIARGLGEILRLARLGKVKRLIVSQKRRLFGKIDASGRIASVHPFDQDHEDDDLLDDIAQTVLTGGGEVVMSDKEVLPSNLIAAAKVDEGARKIITVAG